MKNKGQGVLAGVILLGLVIVFASYKFVYSSYKEKTAVIEAENATLEKKVETLKVYYDNRETYKKNIEMYFSEVETILEKYPADVRYEDVIMQAVYMQMRAPITFDSMTISDKIDLVTVPEETIVNLQDDRYPSSVSFKETETSYMNEVKYDALKAILSQILEKENRVAIKQINYTKATVDEDGQPILSGSIDLAYYSVTGTSKEYVAPSIAEYESQTSNIFGVEIVEEEE